jgi:succinoglycan biosynthesis transport protein ExoP
MSVSADPSVIPGPRLVATQVDNRPLGTGDRGSAAEQLPDLRRVYAMFLRRWRLLAAVAVLIFVAVVVFTMRTTPLFTATANVMLDVRKQQVVDFQSVESGLPADTSVVDTEVEVLKSRQLAERVVSALRLDRDPEFNHALAPPGMLASVVGGIGEVLTSGTPVDAPRTKTAQQRAHERIVDAVLERLSVKRAALTYIINVSFTSHDPAKASQIANAFADKYLTEQLEAKFQATQRANDWLNQRLSELRGQVQSAEAAVQQYKAAHGLVSAGASSLTEQEISSYNQQVAQARAEQAGDEAVLASAKQQLAQGSNGEDLGAALDSPVILQLRTQRAQISAKVADLQTKYGPRHPDLLKAQRELADLDSQIHEEIQRIISNLQAKAEASRRRTGSMETSLGSAKGTLAANNAATVGLNELQRNAEALSSLYDSFLNRFKQTSTEPGMDQSDARVVSWAKIPTKQSAPNIPLNLALGLVVGLGAGVAAALLAELLDTGLTTAEDIEQRLELPHLGSLPLLSSLGEAGSALPVDFIVEKPLSSFSESFRALRASIRFARVGEAAKIVLLTSSLPGEGKTTTSICLGRSAAMAGDRVVILDCDIRRRNISRLIGSEPSQGLVEVLNGQAKLQDALLQDKASGAYILPLAKASFTPKDVFGSDAMDSLLAALRNQFDLVILDSAPTLAVADTRVLASKADAIIFLVKWRGTPLRAIESSLKTLSASGGYIAGVALSLVNMKEQSRYGYGDPGYYYSEYKKYYA